jgi:2-iminobutanoate/2-iminopropanoate deaminase
LRIVQTSDAPAAIGPYSQAVVANGFVFCSGQIAIDPATGALVEDDAATQTRRVLSNLAAVLATSGSGLDRVVKTTVFLRSMDDFPAVNAVYAEVFGESRPARSTVQVTRLPREVAVEIEAIALLR